MGNRKHSKNQGPTKGRSLYIYYGGRVEYGGRGWGAGLSEGRDLSLKLLIVLKFRVKAHLAVF